MILGKFIYSRLYHHINNNHILVNEQFVFRHALSTDFASHNQLNKKLLVGGIFSNIHKVFDYANHDILLSKMEFYDISRKANNLIKSYLPDRYQSVLVDFDSKKYYCKWESVTDGVPQRSIFGLLLFVLYANCI